MKDIDALKKELLANGVHYAFAGYSDMHGVPKGKLVPIAHLHDMLGGSELCTGAALDGVPQDVSDEEGAAHPDPESVMIMPWRKDVAWFASDLWCEGKPFEPCNRTIFKNVLRAAEDMGYRFNLGFEPEFFLLKRNDDGSFAPIGPRDSLAKPAYDIRSTLDSLDLLEAIVRELNTLGYDVYSYDHEDGNGQFEIDYMYCDGLTSADRLVFFRLMVSEIAHQHGCFASFMPKPFAHLPGNGLHLHISLWDENEKKEISCNDDDNDPLSDIGKKFIAGLLKNAHSLTALGCSTVNSYKRILPGSWSPAHICWGAENRSVLIRVPGKGNRKHIELRHGDNAMNPFIYLTGVLAAGFEGIEKNLKVPDPVEIDVGQLSDKGSVNKIEVLPRSLSESISFLKNNQTIKNALGNIIFNEFIKLIETELRHYETHVHHWERLRYMENF